MIDDQASKTGFVRWGGGRMQKLLIKLEVESKLVTAIGYFSAVRVVCEEEEICR